MIRYGFKFHSVHDKFNNTRHTYVTVKDGEEKTVMFADVKQHIKDQDCKLIGQKEAIKKLTEEYEFSKLDKNVLWRDFFTSSKRRLTFFSPSWKY